MAEPTREELEAKLAEMQRQMEALQKQVATQQTGSGAISQGSAAKAAGERGVAAEEITGGVFTGDNPSVTYIIQQAKREDEAIDEQKLRRQITDYLVWVRDRFGTIELRGVHREGRQVVQLDLETVYVPLRATTLGGRRIELDEILEQGQRLIITGGPGSGKTTVLQHIAWVLASAILENDLSLAREKLGYKDLMLDQIRKELEQFQIADPDQETFSSTTKQLRRLVERRFNIEAPLRKHIEQLASKTVADFSMDPQSTRDWPEWLQEDLAAALQLTQQTEEAIALPIFVPLSTYAQERRRQNTPQDRTLAAFITRYLIEKQSGLSLPINFFTCLLDSGHSVILLLDGLDEVPNEQERAAVREAIEDLVTGREHMWVVVTCRTAAYRGRTALGKDFREVQVEALDEKHVANLVRQAYTVVYAADPTLRQVKTNELLHGIADIETERRRRLGESAERLVNSPLLVRMLLVVHLSERRLPEHRAELYMRATDTMLWPEHTLDEEAAQYIGRLVGGTHESHRELVQHLAFAMHRRGPQQGREIEEDDIRLLLSEVPEFVPLTDSFLTLTRLRGTLLEERMGVYRFIHLAFQEYLVARYLAETKRSEGGVEAIACFLEEGSISDSWWREPVLLVVGYLTLTAPRAASQLLRRLVGITTNGETKRAVNPDVRFVGTILAMTAYLEWLSMDNALRRDLAAASVVLLSNVNLARASQPHLRADLGDLLAQLGDPRFDTSTWYLPAEPLLGFIEIPAGPFIIGRDPKLEESVNGWEQPPHELTLPTYYIGRYLVTVAQFRAFCDETSYHPTNFNSLCDPDNRPVRYVTWHDALRYCAWLTETLRAWPGTPEPLATLLRTGVDRNLPWCITLPSEAEWEKAARSVDGRIYPWGSEPDSNAANHNGTGINTTSAVGAFPSGTSPYGCFDMVGNVWEWTRSLWGKDHSEPDFGYPYTPADGREDLTASDRVKRVLRGGSWAEGAVGCGARDWSNPDLVNVYFGFRVVASPFPLEIEPLEFENLHKG